MTSAFSTAGASTAGPSLPAHRPPQRHGRRDRARPAPRREPRGRGLPRRPASRTARGAAARRGRGADPGAAGPARAESRHVPAARRRSPTSPSLPADRLGYADVLSDDGTRLRAWTNDPHGAIDGPTVVLCNGLGTSPWAWPALLDPDCGVRVVSWNHRGTGGSDRPDGPGPGRHRRVRRGRAVGDGPLRRRPGRADGLVDGRQHDVRAGRPAPRAGGRACSRSPGVPGDTFAHHARPVAPPARRRPAAHGRPRPGAAAHRPGADPGRLAGCRSGGGRSRCSATAASCSRSPTASSPRRAVREFLTTPLDWYFHLALRTSEHARVPLQQVRVPTLLRRRDVRRPRRRPRHAHRRGPARRGRRTSSSGPATSSRWSSPSGCTSCCWSSWSGWADAPAGGRPGRWPSPWLAARSPRCSDGDPATGGPTVTAAPTTLADPAGDVRRARESPTSSRRHRRPARSSPPSPPAWRCRGAWTSCPTARPW